MSVPEFTNRQRATAWSFVLGLIGVIAFGVTMAIHAAHADGYIVSCDFMIGVTCFAGPMGNPYVRDVPQPTTDAAKEEQRRRDMIWVHECAPELVRDRYGVMRYQYNDPGCAFGSHP